MKMNVSLPVEIDIPDCVITEIRNKAIDDFVKLYNKGLTIENEYGEKRPMTVEEIAEQLKGGGVDD